MLNIYRVISLSLVMSLFFAAPLLCVHPVSHQLKKEQRLATKNNQAKKVKAVWKSRTHRPYISPTAALANTLQRSATEANEVLYDSEEQTATPAIFVQDQDDDWYGDNSDELDDRSYGVNGVSSTSHTSIYY